MRTVALCCAALASFASVPSARAAEPFEIELFEPLPSQGINHLQVGASRVLQHLQASFGFVLHYQTDPYVIRDADDEVIVDLVAERLTTELWASLGLFDWLEIGVVLPVIVAQGGDGVSSIGGSGTLDGASLRDLRIVPKLQLFESGGFGIGLLGQIHVPTGDASHYASDDGVRGQIRALFDYEHRSGFAVALDGGLDFRPERVSLTHVSDDTLLLGMAVRIPLGVSTVRLLATVHAGVPLVSARDSNDITLESPDGSESALEGDLALQARFGDFVGAIGAGHGFTDGVGSPELRVFALFGYTPEERAQVAVQDSDDQCPGEPEDVDGFEDDDGCPDPDNDRDGILDVNDKCPNVAEDLDGLADEDGCPEDDFDGDGIPDVRDTCPREPETRNGYQDEDGCPDALPSVVLTEVVYFHTAMATIQRVSYPLLDTVAELIIAHPEITEIAIDGHADERGSDEYNDDLTERRAAAVVAYLVERGVPRGRLTARGFGERKPIEQGHDESAWIKNRRVELTILEMSPQTKVAP